MAPPNSEKTPNRGGAKRQCVRSETETGMQQDEREKDRCTKDKQTHTELPVFTDLPDHILPILSKEPTIQVYFIINGLATSY